MLLSILFFPPAFTIILISNHRFYFCLNFIYAECYGTSRVLLGFFGPTFLVIFIHGVKYTSSLFSLMCNIVMNQYAPNNLFTLLLIVIGSIFILGHWFSSRGDFAPRVHWAMSGNNFGCYSGKWGVLLECSV